MKKIKYSEEQINEWLKSIGGIVNGYYKNRDNCFDRSFFEIEDGWLPIVKDLIDNLIKLGWDRQLLQVKEKFGSLRFYSDTLTNEMDKLVHDAVVKSSLTCEFCGTTKNVGKTTGWIKVICESCFNKKKKENNCKRSWESLDKNLKSITE